MPTTVLINSDAGGHPGHYGYLHFVTFHGVPLPAINQMDLATQYDVQACGVANVKSVAEFYGRAIPSDQQIAWDEGNTGKGCSPQGVVNGYAACGLSSTLVSSTPGRAYVLNTAWGGIIPPDQSQPYIAAAAVGWPGGWSIAVVPLAPQPSPGDDDMQQVIIVDSAGHFFRADGTWVTYLETGQEVADVQWVGTNIFKKPVQIVNPVGDILAYGQPTNARTAAILQVAFP